MLSKNGTGLLAVVLLLLAVAGKAQGGAYVLNWEAKGDTFFDGFDFVTNNDPSHGFVNYVNQTYAQSACVLWPGPWG